MANNSEVIETFLKRTGYAKATNLTIEGPGQSELVNYSTTLAQWTSEHGLLVNLARYSASTSKIQYKLKQALKDLDIDFTAVEPDAGRGVRDLTRYLKA